MFSCFARALHAAGNVLTVEKLIEVLKESFHDSKIAKKRRESGVCPKQSRKESEPRVHELKHVRRAIPNNKTRY
jgi:hypothetical protein